MERRKTNFIIRAYNMGNGTVRLVRGRRHFTPSLSVLYTYTAC